MKYYNWEFFLGESYEMKYFGRIGLGEFIRDEISSSERESEMLKYYDQSQWRHVYLSDIHTFSKSSHTVEVLRRFAPIWKNDGWGGK